MATRSRESRTAAAGSGPARQRRAAPVGRTRPRQRGRRSTGCAMPTRPTAEDSVAMSLRGSRRTAPRAREPGRRSFAASRIHRRVVVWTGVPRCRERVRIPEYLPGPGRRCAWKHEPSDLEGSDYVDSARARRMRDFVEGGATRRMRSKDPGTLVAAVETHDAVACRADSAEAAVASREVLAVDLVVGSSRCGTSCATCCESPELRRLVNGADPRGRRVVQRARGRWSVARRCCRRGSSWEARSK